MPSYAHYCHLSNLMTFADFNSAKAAFAGFDDICRFHFPALSEDFRRYPGISVSEIVVSATEIGVSASEMSFTIHFRCENRV